MIRFRHRTLSRARATLTTVLAAPVFGTVTALMYVVLLSSKQSRSTIRSPEIDEFSEPGVSA